MKHIKEELWKPVKHENETLLGRYEISNLGNVRSVARWVYREPSATQTAPNRYWMESKPIVCQALDRKSKAYRTNARYLKCTPVFGGKRHPTIYVRIDELMQTHWPESNYTEADWISIGRLKNSNSNKKAHKRRSLKLKNSHRKGETILKELSKEKFSSPTAEFKAPVTTNALIFEYIIAVALGVAVGLLFKSF